MLEIYESNLNLPFSSSSILPMFSSSLGQANVLSLMRIIATAADNHLSYLLNVKQFYNIMYSMIMAAFKWPQRSPLTSNLNSVTKIAKVDMPFWSLNASMS